MTRVDVSGMVMGLLFIALGAAFLLDRLGYWTINGNVLWPAVLIVLGISVLAGAAFRRR